MTTSAEKRYLDRVASLGCVICHHLGVEQSEAEIHHVRAGQGMAQRAQHWLTVPLCPTHHRGTHGIHGDRQSLKQFKLDELDLLAWTIKQIFEDSV
jgi:hypothetical protein